MNFTIFHFKNWISYSKSTRTKIKRCCEWNWKTNHARIKNDQFTANCTLLFSKFHIHLRTYSLSHADIEWMPCHRWYTQFEWIESTRTTLIESQPNWLWFHALVSTLVFLSVSKRKIKVISTLRMYWWLANEMWFFICFNIYRTAYRALYNRWQTVSINTWYQVVSNITAISILQILHIYGIIVRVVRFIRWILMR